MQAGRRVAVRRISAFLGVIIAQVAVGGCDTSAPPIESRSAAIIDSVQVAGVASRDAFLEFTDIRVDTIASGLDVPWDIAIASEGRVFVTERSGTVRLVENGVLREEPWATFEVYGNHPEFKPESGLMGIALAPDFDRSRHVYVMATFQHVDSATARRFTERVKRRVTSWFSPQAASLWESRVYRLTDAGRRGTDATLIVDGLPASHYHAGGAIDFGPDGRLYVSVGDMTVPGLAQNPRSLAGKILRYAPDGTIPSDNPTAGSPVFARGLRNAQGFAWHLRTGELFAVDHGPSGMHRERYRAGHDEINVIRAGQNYGWPEVIGFETRAGTRSPVHVWEAPIAPASLLVLDDLSTSDRAQVVMTGLQGRRLLRVQLERDLDAPFGWRFGGQQVLYAGGGRLRALTLVGDGTLYVGTSNGDGRGSGRRGSDLLLRVRFSVPRPVIGAARSVGAAGSTSASPGGSCK